MGTQELLEAVLHSDELPTLPAVAATLLNMTSRDDTTLTDIADLVAHDVSLSAKILKVSNSAFYSFPQRIGSIRQAVFLLGTNAVRSLVLSFSFLSIKDGRKNSHFNFDAFWERSLASAVAANLILERVQGADTDEILVSGLLQNLGILILARTFPEQYDAVLRTAEEQGIDIDEAEERVFHVHHSLIGYEVAKAWGFPDILLLPILYHHEPEKYSGGDPAMAASIKAIHLSHILADIIYSGNPVTCHARFRDGAKRLFSFSNETIDDILTIFHTRVKEAGASFDLKIHNIRSVPEILQEANIKLSLINLNYDQMNKELVQAKIDLEKLTRELEEKNRILDHLANLDGLTGIYNHRYFQSALDQELNRAARNKSEMSLVIIDIDHFKRINDTYGHQAGDFVLVSFARTLKKYLRNYDTLARYGGEEFAVILPETNCEEAIIVARKLRVAVAEQTFSDKNEDYKVTASFGIANANPSLDEHFSKSIFVNQADEALYEAKSKGRNRVVVYSPKKKWFTFS
ncbi:MAG: GGDEF domain-containing protein [Desulfobulbaceae bacterium]|jgi:diguanylate cyclase (GGDEF)-like protein|nr:GGDEF domain-containing protein [Desulfobulbaceae bacterium]